MKVIVFGFSVAAMVKLQQLVVSEPDEVYQQLSAPTATSMLVLTAHYDVSITSRLAKNI